MRDVRWWVLAVSSAGLVACAGVERDPRGQWWGFDKCALADREAWCVSRDRAKYGEPRLKL